MKKISPSILSADFSRLGEELKRVEDAGADWIHIDVMDGHFVPNITVGPFILEAVRRVTSLPLDVHLMIERPEQYISGFSDAGADIITVHVEVCPHLHRTIQAIKEKGKKAGVSLNPATPLVLVEAVRRVTSLPLDVHLMIERPEQYIPEFSDAGADIITVHVEACTHLHRTLQAIKEKGKKAGVSLNPATPLVLVEDILNNIDLLVIMSVNPGFGGQKFIISVLDKIKRARQMIDNIGAKVNIEIDGGVKLDNIGEVSSAGADIFVSGSGVFGTKDYKRTIEEMKRIINGK